VTQRPGGPDESEESESRGPVIRDKRRLDPETGALREPVTPREEAMDDTDATVPDDARSLTREDELERQVAERTVDLQRVQAEYANYRRRVDRDREVVRDTAVANVLANLLPVLDDIGRARDHGELEGAFKSVGEALEQSVERLGMVRFGAAGDPFDPTVHEALTHSHSPEVTEPTCVEVFAPGYRIGDRVVRPARVAVAEPE
jgi:molecular chaperone GrpE